MNRKYLQIVFNALLNKQNPESQPYGCRVNNPNICVSHSMPNICSYELKDGICRKPSRVWKWKYTELKMGGDNA